MRYRYSRKVVEIQRPARKAISKSTRFDVFARDNFTCQYCSRKTPTVVLELDHRVAVANGGTDDILNLVTSCEDCNSGKSDKKLYDIPVSPDAAMERLRICQEIREAERYFEARRELDAMEVRLFSDVRRSWREAFEQETRDPITNLEVTDRQIKSWLCNYTAFEIAFALEIVGEYMAGGYKVFTQRRQLYAYISGVLKNSAVAAAARKDAEG